MKTIFKLSLFIMILSCTATAQNYKTQNGHIWFVSEASLENFEAHNRQTSCELDTKTGEFMFTVFMKSFKFGNPEMQEHFNNHYVESEQYPKAFFKGFVKNISSIDFNKNNTYKADIEGTLTIHGITKEIKQSGTIKVKNGSIIGKADFNILLSDFDIKIPQKFVNYISNNINIIVDVTLDKSSTSTASKNEKY